jgi:hypothetical protein
MPGSKSPAAPVGHTRRNRPRRGGDERKGWRWQERGGRQPRPWPRAARSHRLGQLDLLVVDLGPGADRLRALGQWLPRAAAALAVAISTQVALLAVERSLRRAREAGFPLVGLVESLGTSICAKCGAEGPLFRKTVDTGVVEDLDVEVLVRIPFDAGLAAAADRGRPFLEGEGLESVAGRALAQLAARADAYQLPGPEGESW